MSVDSTGLYSSPPFNQLSEVDIHVFGDSMTILFLSILKATGGESRDGTVGPDPPLENHELVYVSLEILVRTPIEKQFDPMCPIASRGRFVRPSDNP